MSEDYPKPSRPVFSFEEVANRILEFLQVSPLPVSPHQISSHMSRYGFSLSQEAILEFLDYLRSRGYDVKEIKESGREYYVLVRTFDVSRSEFKPHGELKLPVIMTGDWHYGSLGFQFESFKEMVEDIEQFGVKSFTICGDIIQGRKVFPTELQELSIPSISGQLEGIVNVLRWIPRDVEIHCVLGNHEEKIRGDVEVGFDPLILLSNTLQNVVYHGHVATLAFGDYKFMMMHGSGFATTASSHVVEKIWRGLAEKPDIFQIGHTHQLLQVSKDDSKTLFVSGTLQRTNAWLMSKGLRAQLGWIILLDYNRGKCSTVVRRVREL